MSKGRVYFTLEQAVNAQNGEQMYSSPFSLTSAIDVDGWKTHASVNLPSGKTVYPLYRTLAGPRNRTRRERKISPARDLIPGPSSP